MTTIRLRRGTADAIAAQNPVLSIGEPVFEKDTGRIKIGDGGTPWNDLPYISDASSTGVLGSFTKSALPSINTEDGAVALVTDSTRGTWRYNGNLNLWIPTDAGNRINLLDFVNPAVHTDCTAGIQEAMLVMARLGGGTLVFPAGYVFKFASPMDFSYNPGAVGGVLRYDAITWEGTATGGHDNSISNLIYTGSGSTAAIKFGSAKGVTLHKMHISASGNLTGDLVDFGWSPYSGSDATLNTITQCVFMGNGTARSLVNLGMSISSVVEKSSFLYAQHGILGLSGDQYSNVMTICGNMFVYLDDYHIWNPGANWFIVYNTFEQDRLSRCRAVGMDGALPVRALVIEANYLGDAAGYQPDEMIYLRRVFGGRVSDNWATVPRNATFARFNSCSGIHIGTNRTEAAENVYYLRGIPSTSGNATITMTGAFNEAMEGWDVRFADARDETNVFIFATILSVIDEDTAVLSTAPLWTHSNNTMRVTNPTFSAVTIKFDDPDPDPDKQELRNRSFTIATNWFGGAFIPMVGTCGNLTMMSNEAADGGFENYIDGITVGANPVAPYNEADRISFGGVSVANLLAQRAAGATIRLLSNGNGANLHAGGMVISPRTDTNFTEVMIAAGTAVDNNVIRFAPDEVRSYRPFSIGYNLDPASHLNGKPITRIRHGVTTLVAGAVTVNDESITEDSQIYVTPQANLAGRIYEHKAARIVGESFKIKSSDSGDTGTVAYFIIEPET
jgi:hypothetical protein